MNAILVFLYIFLIRWRANNPFDSSILVLCYLLLQMLFSKKYLGGVIRFMKTVYVRNVVLAYMMTLVWMVTIIALNGTGDFSFVVTFIHVFIQLFTGLLLFVYFQSRGCEGKIVNYLIIAFALQAAIEWAGFLSPAVSRMIQSTKSQYSLARAETYQGIRGFSLSGNDFFGVTAGFALILLLFWSERNTLFGKNVALRLALYLFIISGTFFAGRTGYIGLGAAIVFLASHTLKKRGRAVLRNAFVVNTLSFAGVGLGVFVAVRYFLEQFRSNTRYYRLFRFTFRQLFEKMENDTFITGSVDHLLSDMYFALPFLTFLVGDGRYTGIDGRSYMHTDAGYMRMILLMGIIGFAFMLAMQLCMISPRRGRERRLKLFALALLLILNIKGEIISCELVVLGTGLLFYLQDLFYRDDAPQENVAARRGGGRIPQ